MVLVATQHVKTAVLVSSKINQRTRRATTAQADGLTKQKDRLDVTKFHQVRTFGMKNFVSVMLDTTALG